MSFPRLRIAFITYKFGHEYGGAEAYGVDVMKELSKRHDITVITREYSTACGINLPYKIITLSELWPSWVRTYLFAKAAAQLCSEADYDLIHSHVNGWIGDIDVLHVKSVRYHWLTRARSAIKKITNLISPRIQMYLWLEKQRVHLKPPRRTVVVSELLKQQLQKAYQTNYPFDVITPGVYIPNKDQNVRQKTRQQLGFSQQDIVCIQVARNPLNKGLSTILDSLTTLPTHIKLLVVGAPNSVEKQLQSQLAQQQLLQRVIFIPQTENINPYYQAADLCLHPTFNDSFGMAPLEAMSHQLPVIMSQANYCGFAHYVTHEHHALLLQDPHNAAELTQAIQRLLTDTVLTQQLAQQGHELALDFSWENIAKQFESIYVDILAARIHQGKPDHRS